MLHTASEVPSQNGNKFVFILLKHNQNIEKWYNKWYVLYYINFIFVANC